MSVSWYSRSRDPRAGARMDDAKGDMNVMMERSTTRSHFRNGVKLSGISGSVWLSHPMMPFERSVIGRIGGGSFSRVLRLDNLLIMLWDLLLVVDL